ncbi:MAG: ribbon-helix-helix protein, CopG family [Spirochaetia bacterium]|nr:ribbon-helix-helix protein, CopG family [Spirochaetia bacterium]
MREKGKNKKTKKILIRVSREEKALAEELSRKEGKNTSEFFRDILRDKTEAKLIATHADIIARYEQTLKKYVDLLGKYNQEQ